MTNVNRRQPSRRALPRSPAPPKAQGSENSGLMALRALSGQEGRLLPSSLTQSFSKPSDRSPAHSPAQSPAQSSVQSYGMSGDLEVRLAASRRDLVKAQRLRYHVFYEEMSAVPGPLAALRRRDQDAYDAICDHLLVTDLKTQKEKPNGWRLPQRADVVGTYRILRQEVAERTIGFYSQSEYDIAPLLAAKRNLKFMELGRSCVHNAYRNKRTIELLWHGLWTYVREHGIDVMIGCASLPGRDLHQHAEALSFLHHNALAPEEWRCKAHDRLYQAMDRLPPQAINTKHALKALPPLIKAYLRLGAFVGDGAVIDNQFDTTDVLIILPVSRIDRRYFGHFGSPGEVQSRLRVTTEGLQ